MSYSNKHLKQTMKEMGRRENGHKNMLVNKVITHISLANYIKNLMLKYKMNSLFMQSAIGLL